MDSENKHLDFINYFQNVKRTLVPFACPDCRVVIMPKDFESHCDEFHGFNRKLACVWCSGSKSWKPRKKSENSIHLLDCFRKFIAPYEMAAALETAAEAKVEAAAATAAATGSQRRESPSVIDVKHLLCPGRRFFDHESRYIREELPNAALDLFSILPVESHPLEYRGGNLNLAASYLAKYLETSDTHDWLHIMVKAVAFESFLRAMEEEGGGTTTTFGLLPFSCWCDGGPYEEARHRQHRHMIAVAPKDYFQSNVWTKVGVADKKDRPCKNYPAKGMKRIVSPMHLVNTMGYLSKRKSRCEFTEKKNRKLPPKEKHFHIFTTLPVQFRHPLCVLWDEGLKVLMYQQLFQNVSVESVIRRPLHWTRSQWRQKIDDFYALPRGLVLPVERDLVPTDRETPRYVHLLNGRRQHFERLPERLNAEVWLARQVAGGNCLYEAVGDEWWVPRKDDQEKLNLVMPREHRIRELGFENGHLKRKYETQIDELVRENRELNHKIHEIYEGEIKRLKLTVTELEEKLKKDNNNNSVCSVNTKNGNTCIDQLIINNNNNINGKVI